METAEIPPCPWADGSWITPGGDRRTIGAIPETDAGYVIDGQRVVLEDDGHILKFADGARWERDPESVLACVSKATMEGMLPGMLAGLKKERSACKKAGEVAKKAGNHAEAVFRDLQQNAIKVHFPRTHVRFPRTYCRLLRVGSAHLKFRSALLKFRPAHPAFELLTDQRTSPCRFS